MEQYLTFTITSAEENTDVASFLKQRGFSKKALSRLKNSAHSFEINAARVNSDYILHDGDTLRVPIFNQHQPKASIVPWVKELVRVYEDEYFLVCDKPSGIPMYPHAKGQSGSLANIMAHHYPNQTFHAFNRLDENTAGLVLLAKSAYILHELQKTSVEKYYLLRVEGCLKGMGIIDFPLLHENGSPKVLVDPSGKEARTAYTALTSAKEQSVVMAHLLTGRTHQIRAHMAAIGHPLCGDVLYGASFRPDGYQLLAYCLEIFHPLTKKKLICESPQALCF